MKMREHGNRELGELSMGPSGLEMGLPYAMPSGGPERMKTMETAVERRAVRDSMSDPAWFARSVRELARDAHQALRVSASPAALGGLAHRIERLGAALDDRHEGPVGNWLDHLGREVRRAASERAGACCSLDVGTWPGCLQGAC